MKGTATTIATTNLPEISGIGYVCSDRKIIRLQSTNGRMHEIELDTLISKEYPNGLHRAFGGGVGFRKKYFISFTNEDLGKRDAFVAQWIDARPELRQIEYEH